MGFKSQVSEQFLLESLGQKGLSDYYIKSYLTEGIIVIYINFYFHLLELGKLYFILTEK